jgi:hypothetical protein
VSDDFWPAPDLGFVWFRDAGGMWVVSGLVNWKFFKDAATLDNLLSRLSDKVIGRNDQLARCIEFVSADFTAVFDGELGEQAGPGGWAEVRWWKRKHGGSS